MVIKINNKPLKVEEEEEKPQTWTYFCVATMGYLLAFYVLDFVAATFLGVHPFPFIQFIGVILSWFS